MTVAPRVVLLGFDAMDPAIVRSLAAAGRLPAFARLLDTSASAEVRNPPGLYVGSLWSSFFTARAANRTGFNCWIRVSPDSYELEQTNPEEIQGIPFWEHLSDDGHRVGILDVPHSRAARPLNGLMVAEWGCHDRHFGLHSQPPELASALAAEHGFHPVLGADPWAAREWAPDDYEFRAGPLRTDDEEEALLAALLDGIRQKGTLSRRLLESEPWDLFVSVVGETHCVGHQSWHVHDPDHPRHDPALPARIGDPLERVYVAADTVLAEHLEAVGDETALFVLLSHGMGPHHDGTHLLPEILRRLDAALDGQVARSTGARHLTRAWARLPAKWRPLAARAVGPWLRYRRRALTLSPARDEETAAERRAQRWFTAPNNFAVGGVRVNLRGRERDGRVAPGDEFDAACRVLAGELRSLVNVDTGEPVVHEVVRSDAVYDRAPQDALPDLFLEWNRHDPIETVWSPRLGMMHGPYVHWRTGDHLSGGSLLVRGPGFGAGRRLAPLRTEDIAPTLATMLGTELPAVDGRPARWAHRPAATQPMPSWDG